MLAHVREGARRVVGFVADHWPRDFPEEAIWITPERLAEQIKEGATFRLCAIDGERLPRFHGQYPLILGATFADFVNGVPLSVKVVEESGPGAWSGNAQGEVVVIPEPDAP